MKKILIVAISVVVTLQAAAQLPTPKKTSTRADTLRGSVTPERAWWNVLHYDLHVQFNPADSSLRGHNSITYKVLTSHQLMQIDLMEPLTIDSMIQSSSKLKYKKEGNVYWVGLVSTQKEKEIQSLTVYFHGKPHIAARPPWNGGVIWAKDNYGRPWISVACQGIGASVWYPCKDHQYDEPDSASIHITATTDLVAVSNGRLRNKKTNADGTITWSWSVRNPINNYDLIPYLGHYVNFNDVYAGEKGKLDVSYWVLDYNIDQAHLHLEPEVNRMLKDLEYWFGPYPFYEDGYKIVDAPHLGMEHQTAIAYGNKYQNGYLGRDMSKSGWGSKWDFIVVHESAHEWFGNNITTKELADMWVHESFANYAETLFTEREYGKDAGTDYVVGIREGIRNDTPIIGIYNVNQKGSGDMYPKGGNMLHTIRQIIDNDEKFRQILRGMNRDFYHQTVTTQQIESYISKKSGKDLSKVFDQYLRTTNIPVLTWSVTKHPGYLTYSWTNCIEGYDMPVKVSLNGNTVWLKPTMKVQERKLESPVTTDKIVDRNFYINEKKE